MAGRVSQTKLSPRPPPHSSRSGYPTDIFIWWLSFLFNRLKISCPILAASWACGLDSLLWLWLNSWSFSCYFSTQRLKPAEPKKQPSQAVYRIGYRGSVQRKCHRCLVAFVISRLHFNRMHITRSPWAPDITIWTIWYSNRIELMIGRFPFKQKFLKFRREDQNWYRNFLRKFPENPKKLN